MPVTHESRLDDSDLCHVGPGTPAGEMFRRYWLVISRSEDLKDIPQGITVLGEQLVLFRDGTGAARARRPALFSSWKLFGVR
jgi:hypothetical protein